MSTSIETLLGFVTGMAGTFLFAVPSIREVRRIRDNSNREPPDGVSHEHWLFATEIDEKAALGTAFLWKLEQVLYFIAFWSGQAVLIGGWLAFKLGSKWATWQHIMKVPGRLEPNAEPIDLWQEMGARNRWGSSVLQRWLIGTLGNVLAALLGTGLGRLVVGDGRWLSSLVAGAF